MSPAAQASPSSTYDAYVSYGEADRGWVEEELVPRIEGAGRRVFLESDLPPGGVEIEERSRAVEASRKTVLIVSEEYLDGGWGLLEEAIARQLDPAARKRRLIPVLRSGQEPPLRIRPLVAVDLRGGGTSRQWDRLLSALDPAREAESGGVFQRMSLRLAEATSEMVQPTWHAAGTVWLAGAYLTVAAAVLLVWLLVWEVPPLRHSVPLVLGAPFHGLAAMIWREDRDLFRRLSHLLGSSWLGRGGVVGLAATTLVAWGWVGVPAVRAIVCGPLGCREPGTTYLTILDFDGLATGLADEERWTRGTRRALELKLSAVPGLAVLGQDVPHIDPQARRKLGIDYTVSGQLESDPQPVLTAVLLDRRERIVPPPVRVEGKEVSAASGQLGSLQNRLAQGLLERLALGVTPEEEERVARIPTDVPEAVELNEEAFHLRLEGRFEEADDKLREALELDDGYSVAWSNRAEVAWRTGRYDEALTYRQAAVERLPTYAPFHYNLGHLLAFLGREEEALEALAKALELDPAHVPSFNESGNVLLSLGEPRRAAEMLRRGLLLDPGFAPSAKNLGRALLDTGEAEEAVESLERSLTLYPAEDWLGRTEALALLVQALAGWDQEAACGHFDELRNLDPVGVSPWAPDAEAAAMDLPCAEGAFEEKQNV